MTLPSPATDHEQATHLSYIEKWKEQMRQAYETANRQSMQSKSKDVEQHNGKRLRASILLPGDRVLMWNISEQGGTGKLRSFWENKVHIVWKTYGGNPLLYRVQAQNDPNGRTRSLHWQQSPTMWWLVRQFQLKFDKKEKRKSESTVEKNTKKVAKHKKEMQEESSKDELPQFTLAEMRTLIDKNTEGEFMCLSGNKEDKIRYEVQ